MTIDESMLIDYFECHYKAAIRAGLVSDQKTISVQCPEYETEYRRRALASIIQHTTFKEVEHLELAIGAQQNDSIIGNITLAVEDLKCQLDGLLVLKKTPRSRRAYEPIVCAKFFAGVSKHESQRLAFAAILIERLFGTLPETGRVIHGQSFSSTRIKLKRGIKEVKKAIGDIRMMRGDVQSYFRLNRHCAECEHSITCREKATKIDHLSLIDNIGEKEINVLNARGIFTVTQLAHTFRPRRSVSKKPHVKQNHALRAKAIRDEKIYVVHADEIPTAEDTLYLDVEGIPDLSFYYLVGLLVVRNGQRQYYQFWADSCEDQARVWKAFLDVIRGLDKFVLFHYGRYDAGYLGEMEKRYGCEALISDVIHKSMVNVLSLIYGKIYFPTYGNSLKEIAAFAGFRWTQGQVSGHHSILWRKKWEFTRNDEDRDALLQYNQDDCTALENVVAALRRIENRGDSNEANISSVEDIEITSTLKFGAVDFCLPEFDYINKCAYFDYQRNKISLARRSSRKKPPGQKSVRLRQRPNKIVVLEPSRTCPGCGSDSLYKHGRYKKTVLNLKFSKFGVRRHVVRYIGPRKRCRSCQKAFFHKRFLRIRSRYDHELCCWVIYQHVATRQSLIKVIEVCRALFGYSFNRSQFSRVKRIMATRYAATVQLLVRKIREGNVVHVDETTVNIRGEKAYVWVFSSLDEAVYFYSDSREGQLLKDVLGKFSGVLISDFYSAYDSIGCAQQKCLVHLIRDMNEDYRRNQFDPELTRLVQHFALLLRSIVGTVDKFGLHKKRLEKHTEEAERLLDEVCNGDFRSDVARHYQRRFQKNRGKLFTFLHYNNVPWNNNAAENAIKAFAMYRRLADGLFSRDGIRDYLIFLSIYQTCKLRGISFLHFLLSKRKNLDEYASWL